MPELQGRRMNNYAEDFRWEDVQPGDYWPVQHGDHRDLWFRDPDGIVGRCCQHTLTEHDDGTFTVEPSIANKLGEETWHGFLRKGVWSW